MAGLTRCANQNPVGTIGNRRLSDAKKVTDEQQKVELSKHQKMAEEINSVVRDVQAKQVLVSTPAFESAIEKCMNQLKSTVMSAADQEYNTLRERIRLLEIDMSLIRRENELLKQQQTLDQRHEFEMLMRMTVEEVAMYLATTSAPTTTTTTTQQNQSKKIRKNFDDTNIYNQQQHPILFENYYATTTTAAAATGKQFYENKLHQHGQYR